MPRDEEGASKHKCSHVAFLNAATKLNGAAFLPQVVATFPYAIDTVLTNNGMAFTDLPKYRDGSTAQWMGHLFDRVCREHGIKHKFTKPYHPWTTDEIEQSFLCDPVLLSVCPWVTARHRAGHEVQALPRSHYGRSSFAALMGTLRPRLVQPSVSRL